jgi:SAM-dependent methyltransferase
VSDVPEPTRTGPSEGLVADPADPATVRSARSFGAAASVYHASRPGYPVDAIAWLIGDAQRVLDLGAGTGKLTEALIELDRDVVAVDPVEEMLEELEVAVPEIARVLRPGGVLGLVWNSRNTSADWLREAGEIMHERHDASATFESYVRIGPPFGPIEEHTVEWREPMSRSRFLDLVRSRSYFITASPEEQASTIATLETLLDTHPDVAGAEELAVPYVTRCFRARLL